LYLNLRGREREECRTRPAGRSSAEQIKDELLGVRDPQNNVAAITA